MKSIKSLITAVLLLTTVLFAESRQYDIPGVGSFSYGDGWNKGQRGGSTAGELDWLVSTADKNANFHVIVARADVSYDDWVKNTMKTASPFRVLASKQDFVTTSGEKGTKLSWKIKTKDGKDLVIDQYLFRGKGDLQIQLSGLSPADDAATFDPVFDGFAKSFVLTK